jgi:hypothetical protein
VDNRHAYHPPICRNCLLFYRPSQTLSSELLGRLSGVVQADHVRSVEPGSDSRREAWPDSGRAAAHNRRQRTDECHLSRSGRTCQVTKASGTLTNRQAGVAEPSRCRSSGAAARDRVRRSPRRDYRTRSKAPRTMASNRVGVDGGSAAAGSLSIAATTKVWPLPLVAR